MERTEDDNKSVPAVVRALQEAHRLAEARGLTASQIAWESDDEESQYWEDYRETLARLRGEKGAIRH